MPTERLGASLFVFAHPDDEFFCLPFIKRDCDKGLKVVCVYLTDGAFGEQCPRRRTLESLVVLERFGINRVNVHFLGVRFGIPDGQLHLHARQAFEALLEIAQSEILTNIYIPAWEGGHQDHDTCHVLAITLADSISGPKPMQFSLYNGATHILPFRVMHPLVQNGEVISLRVTWSEALRYLLIAFAYPSQWKTWLGLFPFSVWSVLRRRCYAVQRTSVLRLWERPHVGKLLYERRCNIGFDEVTGALHEFYKQIRI